MYRCFFIIIVYSLLLYIYIIVYREFMYPLHCVFMYQCLQVTNFRLSKRDRFLILASDGLWEQMSNERAVEIVGDHLIGMAARDKFSPDNYSSLALGHINGLLRDRKRGVAYRHSDVNGATHLIRHAIGKDHRKVSEMLTLPAAMSRFYRDDITAIVVYFDVDFLEANAED